jgi:hypothetical protein
MPLLNTKRIYKVYILSHRQPKKSEIYQFFERGNRDGADDRGDYGGALDQ